MLLRFGCYKLTYIWAKSCEESLKKLLTSAACPCGELNKIRKQHDW